MQTSIAPAFRSGARPLRAQQAARSPTPSRIGTRRATSDRPRVRHRAPGTDRRRGLRQSEHIRRSDSDPELHASADNGLRYNRFHVTALCSPTRAALLTGRNHHRVGFGMVGEFSGPFPGYNATIPHDCAPFPRILQENGYLTGGFGKWHLTPDNQQGFSGPSTAGRRDSGSTTSGASSAARPGSTTR